MPETPRLLIAHSSADRYGSDIVCRLIAHSAARAGWAVLVLLPTEGPLAQDLRDDGIGVTILDPVVLRRADLRGPGLLLMPLRWARAALRLRAFARARPRYDVVHSNCAPTLGGVLLARVWAAKHVWYVHEILTSRTQRTVFDRVLVHSADRVLACSASVLKQFPRVVAAASGQVVYTGVDVPDSVAREEPLTRDEPVVVCVGRLNGWKGQGVLIDAVDHLRTRGVNVRVQLVGSVFRQEHQFERSLRARANELGLTNQVEFLGERRDALEIVGRADIAVLPSTRPEPFGMALVEAMALGRPVVATARGGPAELITDGLDGLLVPPNDAIALADALQRLIEAPDLARAMGSQAAKRARSLTTEAMSKAVLATYDELLAARV